MQVFHRRESVRHFPFAFGPVRERANLILSVLARLRTDDALRLSNIPMAAVLSPAAALDRSWPSSSGAHGPALYGGTVISSSSAPARRPC
jgi:hypothetical protein